MTDGAWNAVRLVPAVYAAGALLAAGRRRPWRVAVPGTAAALALTVAAVAGGALGASRGSGVPGVVAPVALLVAFLGWVITRYSARYLEGEPGQARYATALLATLAAVAAVVTSTHLGMLILAWAASSVGLHHLLTFYRERAPAIVVAHKKFLASRLAELCLVIAAVLLYREWGTLDLDALAAHARATAVPGTGVAVAATLLALGAILKSAQLPLHGWLIQVMEAPTPVSALLHAGIVNLGGFVLIRLAPLVAAVPAAGTLLVVVGSLTAVLAGLVMTTRVSIKVRLAWSTCSQMGFMLMEIGLGLTALALLHLLAHSLYKAHAFLTAGEAVEASRRRSLCAPLPASRPGRLALWRAGVLPAALAIALGAAFLWDALPQAAPLPWVAAALAAFGLATLWWDPAAGAPRLLARNLLVMAGVMQLDLAWHRAFSHLVPPAGPAAAGGIAAWVVACFIALYAMQLLTSTFPRGALARALYPWVYGGFYLDERYTRLTFRLWPARIPGGERT